MPNRHFRRTLTIAGSAMATALFLATSPAAAQQLASTLQTKAPSMQSVSFKNGDIDMAGNLYLPSGFDPAKKYAAVVVVHPGGGVKEQTAGLYAARLASEGFVALAFDASHQGTSGGLPRFLDDPTKRVGDIYSAVDYLTTRAYVDIGRIGALGICAGSGHAIKATTTDRRIKAVAIVSGVDVGAMRQRDWNGARVDSDPITALGAVSQQRTAEANGAIPRYVPYVPAIGDHTAPRDLQEAAEYYLGARGKHPNAPNRMLMTSAIYATSYSGFDQAETLLTQPLLAIAGSEAGSLWHSRELYAKAPGKKELFIVPGATHMDLYDGAGAETAAQKLAPFFKNNL